MARLSAAAISTLAVMAISAATWAQSAGESTGEDSVADKPPTVKPEIEPPAAQTPGVAPPSTYDLKETGEDVTDQPQPEEINWGMQLVKTVIALLIVVGLIYFVFKVGLARLLGYATTARGDKSLKVVDRLQLDARHAIFLVELGPGKRLLLGTGERGVQVLSRLGANGLPAKNAESFESVLGKTAAGAVVTMPAPEGDRDAHDAS